MLLDPTYGFWRLLQEMELTRRDSGLFEETKRRRGRRGGFLEGNLGREIVEEDDGCRSLSMASLSLSLSLSATSSEAKRDLKQREGGLRALLF